MRKAIWILASCGVVWAAIWIVLTQLGAYAVRSWFDHQRAAGLVATHDGVRAHGFPHRFGIAVMQPFIEDSTAPVAWQAPRLDIAAAAHRPHHVVVTWPDQQQLRVAGWDVALRSEALRAAMTLQPLAGFAPGHGALTGRALEVEAAGLTSRLGTLDLALDQLASDPQSWNVALDATALELPQLVTMLPENPPRSIEQLHVDAALHTAPRDAAAGAPVRGWAGQLELHRMQLSWGEMELGLQGDMTAAHDGALSGRFTLRARNWQQMLEMATALGVLGDERAEFLRRALQTLDDGTEGEQTLEVPLTLADGHVRIGRIPIAPLPR